MNCLSLKFNYLKKQLISIAFLCILDFTLNLRFADGFYGHEIGRNIAQYPVTTILS